MLTKAGGQEGVIEMTSLNLLFSEPRRRAGATRGPRRGRSAAGCGDGLREPHELTFSAPDRKEGKASQSSGVARVNLQKTVLSV